MKIDKKVIVGIIIFLVIVLLVLCFCFGKKKESKTILETYTTLDYSKLIYKFDDGKALYSKFDNNNYLEGKTIDLKEALEKKVTTIDKILEEMDYVDSLNDGGSMIYQSKDKKFMIYACNSLSGNHNYYITGNYDDVCSFNSNVGVDTNCLDAKLGGMIADLENEVYKVDARKITSGNIYSWDIYKNDKVGSYAIIRTNDNQVIEDFKKYYNNLTSNYKYVNIYEDWYVFIGNGFDDIDLRELRECIK